MKFPSVLVSSLVVALAGAAFATSAHAASNLPRSAPEGQGVSSAAILDFVDTAEAKINALHSLVLVRHGQVVAEGWWAPYAAGEPHQMFSLSKSFTSTAVGLAIAEGKLKVDDLVLPFFPGEAPEKPSANLRAMRVRDLLTMSTGHHNEDIQTFPYNDPDSVVKKFLAVPVTHKPGTFFVYNTPGSYMLSAIVQKVTGQSVLEYLKPRLFEPLGIENPTWEASPQGVSMGGFGLNLRTEDIAKFGQLYLQRGQWQGKQLVPAAWVDTATSRWMSNGSAPTSDWEQGYGFQFWRCRYGVFRGDGAHGQFCVVFPEQDAVLALTSGTRDLQGVLNVVWDKLLPALQGKTALPADAAAHAKLQEKLRGLSLRQPPAVATPALAQEIAGKRYVFPPNASAITAVTLSNPSTDGKGTELLMNFAGAERRLVLPSGTWQRSEMKVGAQPEAIATSGAWTAPDTFTFDVVRYRTPFANRYKLRFAEDKVTLEFQPNVGATAGAPVTGRRE